MPNLDPPCPKCGGKEGSMTWQEVPQKLWCKCWKCRHKWFQDSKKSEEMLETIREARKYLIKPKDAVDALSRSFKKDMNFAWTWHCNIAMAMVDNGCDRDDANLGAAHFMKLAFGVDTKQCDEWIDLMGDTNE